MKKIIIALTVVVLAVYTQAATFQWSVSDVKTTDGTGLASGYSAWMFLSQTSVSQTIGVLSVTDAVSLIEAGKFSDLKGYRYKVGSTTGGSASPSAYNGNWQSGDTLTAYAIVFDTTASKVLSGEAAYYMVVEADQITFPDATSPMSASISFSSSTWKAVPEPTSGLLLVFGIAGLALRRKCA